MKTRYVVIEVPESLRAGQFIFNAIDWYNQRYDSAQDYFYMSDERFVDIMVMYIEFCKNSTK